MKETKITQAEYPLIRSIPADKYIVNMALLAQKLPLMDSAQCRIKYKAGQHEIKVEMTGTGDWKITPFDMVVYSAAASLYDAGNKAFTISMLARTMTGHRTASTVSATLCSAIEASVNKMNALTIRIIAPDKELHDKLLYVEPNQARNDNGTVCTHYYYRCEPVLLTYCKELGHLSTYSIEAVNTIDQLNNTWDVIMVRHYVLRRVAVAVRSSRYNKIAYDTLAAECGVPAKKVRHICCCVLDHLTKIDLIWGYDEYKHGRKYAGAALRAAPKRR